jgi:glutaredoxin
MSFILKLVRNVLGYIIATVDWLTRGKKQQRSSEQQAFVEAQTSNMALYQFFACPFCIKTRRAMHKMNLPIETRNATAGSVYRQELEQQGGKIQVPCLRIQTVKGDEWLYDSSEIIAYLQQRFA